MNQNSNLNSSRLAELEKENQELKEFIKKKDENIKKMLVTLSEEDEIAKRNHEK